MWSKHQHGPLRGAGMTADVRDFCSGALNKAQSVTGPQHKSNLCMKIQTSMITKVRLKSKSFVFEATALVF